MCTSTFLFPDVNVWLALAYGVHPQHSTCAAWGEALPEDAFLFFCRFTQLGLLRLLTNRSTMTIDVLTQAQAWRVYDSFLQRPGTSLIEEPEDINRLFRRHTNRNEISTKQWADGYLSAFAEGHKLSLVTFDHALHTRAAGSILLES